MRRQVRPDRVGTRRGRRAGIGAATLAAAALAVGMGLAGGLAGCAVDFANRHAAQEVEARARPPGSPYLGWRIYQQRCAACHGDSAEVLGGVPGAPDLRERMRGLGPHRFIDLVLRRYEGLVAPGSPRETLVDDIVERRAGELTMPEWQGEPLVQAHLVDLHAYLVARSEGRLGPGRPAR